MLSLRRSRHITNQMILTRSYASLGRPKIASVLPARPTKKIRVGKARPAIYHKFDTLVELSDGSVITRRTQIPKEETRMIIDQRTNPLWNPSKPDMSQLDAENNGRMSKFKSRFSQFEHSGKTEEEVKAEQEALEKERRQRILTGTGVKLDETLADDYVSVLGDNYVAPKLGGKVARKEKGSKKR
ncbi:hypothetical protein KL930_001977 [Ogataea haglerorum]|uniref:Ribosomal protein bL31m N-terminal domain-containing protein n=1 Tax=Ogataea haglerorum TaxID=1937702 RepID=A0AAN6D8S9_9ASCO|nr:uncharacterized protein KL911_001918 [Ogataea haglerorum]KAG7698316.1 hypothetical protein KL915_002033 [Ogataea haglerorum]KAG7699391.1 hypothetical protein KL951_001108 [Ogataea haglerorum]KAG7708537.1 hypothetical protein KL914_002263 [Ogataea haglerorum]KAG7710434.1 hypothetical protein KL950_001347 [Ogataea haglerorum]KAG7721058.1 hypothetical protein KL913_000794 [Ogataea haglerorum]